MFESVLKFWFEEIQPAQQWRADPEFDTLVTERFGELHSRAIRSELFSWRIEPRGRLAEVIILDQSSRNMFRNQSRAFEADSHALALSQETVAIGIDLQLKQADA